jgi:hypothetical protein
MKFLSAAAVALLALLPYWASGVRAQEAEPSAEPSSPAPTQVPPPPPEHVAPPSEAQVQTVRHPARRHAHVRVRGDGQWVYTEQYGWIWIPYGAQYTYEPTDPDDQPYEYVYCPSYGWSWLAAPWVFGWGAFPHFGAMGPARYRWYHHAGFVRSPGAVGSTQGDRPGDGLHHPGLVGRPAFVGHPVFVGPPGFGVARPNPVRIVPDPGFAGRPPAHVGSGAGYAPSGRFTR